MDIPAGHLERMQALMPELKPEQIERNQEGLVNDVYIVARRRVFRFPKTESGRDLLFEENRMLNLAQAHSELKLPTFDILKRDVASYLYLEGVPLLHDDLYRMPPAARQRMAETLGRFLHSLHELPTSELNAHDIPPSVTNRTREDWMRLQSDVERLIVPLLLSDGREWVRRLFAPLQREHDFMRARPCFINGDLGPYHLLFDPQRRQLNGVLDFGTAGRGDPAVDIACLINNYGETFVRLMLATYPSLPERIERARFWAGTLELQWVLGGLRTEDPSWFTVHLGRARDIFPLGSGF